MTKPFDVRWMTPESADADAPGVHALIMGLARFENWAEHVDITVEEIARRARLPEPPFWAVLAETAADEDGTHGRLVGFATLFRLDYTYARKPSLELEMIFVEEGWRRAGVGRALMEQIIKFGELGGYAELEWNVLKSNARAQAFYRQFGADEQAEWQRWGLVFPPS